jgi:hypothetical protein
MTNPHSNVTANAPRPMNVRTARAPQGSFRADREDLIPKVVDLLDLKAERRPLAAHIVEVLANSINAAVAHGLAADSNETYLDVGAAQSGKSLDIAPRERVKPLRSTATFSCDIAYPSSPRTLRASAWLS